ncbi:MAG: hypothetical protein ACKOHH_03285 [Bacteroidota bacterium]
MKVYCSRLRLGLWGLLLWSSVLTAVPQHVAAQCPMCKTSLESNRKDDQKGVGRGLNKGILYLLAMPFLLVGTVGGLYWHRQRRFEESEERRRQILEN